MKLVTTLASLYNTAGSATSYAAKTRIFPYKTVGSRRVLLTAVWTASPWWNNSFTVRRVQRWTSDILTHLLIVWEKNRSTYFYPVSNTTILNNLFVLLHAFN